MPINNNTDNPAEINEIEAVFPEKSVRIHYMDYHVSTAISGSYTKDQRILNGVSESYSYPEKIKLVGHWKESGFESKIFVIKTVLNTVELLNQHLTYIPSFPSTSLQLDCAMYDFFMLVDLKTGFSGKDKAGQNSNKKSIFHLGRGFSRHYNTAKNTWYGGVFGSITNTPTSQYNTVGVFEQVLELGFTYSLKCPNRISNKNDSDLLRIIDKKAIPPLKYLDVYEKLSSPVISTFTIDSITVPSGYKPLQFNVSDTNLPPSFRRDYIKGIDYDQLNLVQSQNNIPLSNNKFEFTYDDGAAQILQRATYSMNCYIKTIAKDSRVKNNINNLYEYQVETQPSLYSEFGKRISGYINWNYSNNLSIQNRIGVLLGKLNLNVSNNFNQYSGGYLDFFSGNTVYATCDQNYIICRYDIFDQNGSGFTEITDKENSTVGMAISMPKKLRLEVDTHFYDQAVTKNSDRRFNYEIPRYKVLFTDYDNDPKFQNSLTLINGWTGVDRYEGLSEFRNGEEARNLNTHYFLYDLKTFLKSQIQQRNSNVDKINKIEYDKNTDPDSNVKKHILLKKFNNLVNVKLMARNEIYEGRRYNPNDDDYDAQVYFKAQMKPAFSYYRYNKLPNENKTKLNSLVRLNAPNILPTNTADENSFFNLNTYRFLDYSIKFGSIPGSTISREKYRITIWESSGIGITQRYYDKETDVFLVGNEVVAYDYVDLMFPDFPGKRIDNQDDPYPRYGKVLSDGDSKNNPNYGCSKIIAIDVNSEKSVTSFDLNTNISVPDRPVGYDILRFNPPSGSDSNLKQYKSDNSNILVRRLLHMELSRKHEEEFDLIFDKSSGTGSTLIKMSEFVDNLNNNHPGLDCSLNPESKDILATYTQGLHYNLGNTIDQSYKKINTFKDPDPEKFEESEDNLIYCSDIYQGVFLDFPPFIEDFFEIKSKDTFISDSKRTPQNSDYHLICKGSCTLRSVIVGTMDIDSKNVLPREPDLRRGVRFFQIGPNNNFIDRDTVFASGYDGEDGWFRSAGFGITYDYGNISEDKLKNGLAVHQFASNYEFNKDYENWTWYSKTRNLPSKLTRLSIANELDFKSNSYVNNITEDKDFFTAVGSKIDNITSVLLGKAYDNPSPFEGFAQRDERTRIVRSATSRIINIQDITKDKAVSVYDLESEEFYPRLLTQNIPKNISYISISESYKFPSSGTAFTSQGIVRSNSAPNNVNSWTYFASSGDIISRLFKHTERNSYQISPNFQDIYCLGDYKNKALVLQVASFDIVKSENGNVYPFNNKAAYIVDGLEPFAMENFSKDFPEFKRQFVSSSSTPFKYSSLVCTDVDNLLIFYTMFNGVNVYANSIQSAALINNNVSVGIDFMRSTDITTNQRGGEFEDLITNYDFIYDSVQKLIKCVLLVTTKFNSNGDVDNQNHILYTEFDNNSGTIIKPLRFHYVAGNYDKRLFKDNVFYSDTGDQQITIPYHKPAIYIISNRERKGLTGIFYKNNNNDLFQKTVKFLSYTSETITI